MTDSRLELTLEEIVLWVADLDRSVAFYRDALLLKLTVDRPAWKVFDTGATRLCLRPRASVYAPELARHGQVEGHPGAEIVFRVENLDAAYASLCERGQMFELAPRELPFGRVASLCDPDGNSVTFFEKPA